MFILFTRFSRVILLLALSVGMSVSQATEITLGVSPTDFVSVQPHDSGNVSVGFTDAVIGWDASSSLGCKTTTKFVLIAQNDPSKNLYVAMILARPDNAWISFRVSDIAPDGSLISSTQSCLVTTSWMSL